MSAPVHPRRLPRTGQSGFTLIEVVLGAAVTAILSLAIIGCVMQMNRLRRLDEELVMARFACRNQMEAIRATPFTDLLAWNGTAFDVPSLDGAATALRSPPDDLDGLPGSITVTAEETTGQYTIYRARVAVRWVGTAGIQDFVYQCLFTERRIS